MSFLDGTVRTGLVAGDEVVDLTDPAIGLPGAMVELLGLGEDARDALAGAASSRARRVPLENAHLLAPVPHPPHSNFDPRHG